MKFMLTAHRGRAIAMLGSALLLSACGDRQAASPVTAPGSPTAAKTRVLEAGASALQTTPPIEALNTYLDGFHFYNGQMDHQMEAHHFCSVLNEDVTQCVIYDSNARDGKLMGVEYIISAKLFAGLEASEKALWHSHVHEVKSGQLVAPGIPDVAEHELMKKIIGTYGKTWHTWHTDQQKTLPLGMPQLMMGFVADGQAAPGMVTARDHRLGIDSRQKREEREPIPAPLVDPGADAWQHGRVVQIPPQAGGSKHP
ncbi:OBAP family protein [Cupriavidus agavae]|uniref:Uncharacterized protein DUF1264 n=1 Tax=Cupriavidus agavae TaxID=1001822 RepID=A0A4Q7RP80_9BURK|nr:OBAP family protein [Cupriavidus agavae]RZT35451.1 uncharacterized protein DUF1264 [Cupriavidus agavae]